MSWPNLLVQVENVNSMIKRDGELDAKFCRARGLGAHTVAVLALAVVHNLELAMTDPLADNADEADDDHPDGTDDGSEGATDNADIPELPEDDRGGLPTQSTALTRPEPSF